MDSELIEVAERVTAKLDRIPDSDAVTLDKTDVRVLIAAVFEAAQKGHNFDKESITPTDDEREDEHQAQMVAFETAKLEARNSMRHDPHVWHEALEDALDKVLPEVWRAAAGFRRPVLPERETSHNGIVASYCPINGDLLAGPRSLRCLEAPEGHEFMPAPEPQTEPTDAGMTIDTDPAADGHRDLIGFLRENAAELGIVKPETEPTDAPKCGGGRTNCRHDQWPPMHTMACPVSEARAAAETTNENGSAER